VSAWRELGRRIRRGRDYRELADAERAAVVGLPVRAAAVVFELLAEDREGAQLVVVPSENEVLAWTEAAGLLRGPGRARLIPFPSPALTPYQQAEASLLVRAQESTAYDALLGASRVTVVCTPRALFHRLARPDAFLGSVVELEVGGEVSPEDLLPRLLATATGRTPPWRPSARSPPPASTRAWRRARPASRWACGRPPPRPACPTRCRAWAPS